MASASCESGVASGTRNAHGAVPLRSARRLATLAARTVLRLGVGLLLVRSLLMVPLP